MRLIEIPKADLEEMQSFYGPRIRLQPWPSLEPPWCIEYKEARFGLVWAVEDELKKLKEEIRRSVEEDVDLKDLFAQLKKDKQSLAQKNLSPRQLLTHSRATTTEKMYIRLDNIYKEKIELQFQAEIKENKRYGGMGVERRLLRKKQFPERQKLRHDLKADKITIDEYMKQHNALEDKLTGQPTGLSRIGRHDKSSSPPRMTVEQQWSMYTADWQHDVELGQAPNDLGNPWVPGGWDAAAGDAW